MTNKSALNRPLMTPDTFYATFVDRYEAATPEDRADLESDVWVKIHALNANDAAEEWCAIWDSSTLEYDQGGYCVLVRTEDDPAITIFDVTIEHRPIYTASPGKPLT